MPPKNLRGEKSQFLAIFGPKIDTLSPAIPNARKIGKSKTIGLICGYVRMSIPNMVGPPPTCEVGCRCPLDVVVGQVNFESI